MIGLGLPLGLKNYTFVAGGGGFPTNGLVFNGGNFDGSSDFAPDLSGEGNDAILYSGRATRLDGVGEYIVLPAMGTPVRKIKVLARADAGQILGVQTEPPGVLLNVTQTPPFTGGVWQEVELELEVTSGGNAPLAGELRLGSSIFGFFAGDIARATLEDFSGNVLDVINFNNHADVDVNGLNGKPVISLNGRIGRHVGGLEVIQEAGDIGGLTPPQVLGLDFNQYLYFNGVDTQIDCGAPLIPANGDFVLSGISQTFYDGSTFDALFSQYFDPPSEGRFLVIARDGNLGLFIGSSLGNVEIESSGVDLTQPFNWEVERSGDTFTLRVNGVDVGSDTRNISIYQGRNSFIGSAPTVSNSYFEGINRVFLDGVQLTGTESGTFENVLVPKALTGNLDALGNPIEKPRTSNTFNADDVGYALIPDSNSLDVTTEATWVFKGNFHGPAVSESEAMLGKWGPSSGERSFLFTRSGSNPDDNEIRIALSSNGTAVHRQDFQTIDADSLWVVRYDGPSGILKVERDGVELVSQDTVGAFPSSLHVSNIPFFICANGEEGDVINLSSRPTSSIKFYNRYLTDEEVQSL
jgi:hypothetical protein